MDARNLTSREARESYINDRLLKLTYYWFNVILLIGAALYIFFSLVDFFVARGHFRDFLALRMAVAVSLVTAAVLNYLVNRRAVRSTILYSLIFIAPMISALVIELMILRLGGHESFYYAGLILVVISALGFIPMNFAMSLTCAGMIYLIYLLPILVYDKITNPPLFVSNNAFLLSATIIALFWRWLNQRNLIRTLSLQYELDQDKQKLEQHSDHLEVLVTRRTMELNKSEILYRSLFEYANDGIITLDYDGAIVNANQKACELYGYERDELLGKSIDIIETSGTTPVAEEWLGRIRAGESLLFETQHARKDSEVISVEVSARSLKIQGRMMIQAFYRDITEKKMLQAQLLHSQKMESIGQLAGGISHDFNNLLTSILGFSELLLMDDNLDESNIHTVQNIESAARSGSHMVSKLLSFARRGDFEPVPFDVNNVILDTLGIIEGLIRKQIAVHRNLMEQLPPIEGDPGQIEQVLMNLIINAKDAMPDGGDLHIETSQVCLGPQSLSVAANVPKAEYVSIKITDTGRGIPAEHIDHIFEPFFTTKDEGKGTGLGLAMTYGIIKEHKGYITVDSVVGSGSVFNIYLPASPLAS